MAKKSAKLIKLAKKIKDKKLRKKVVDFIKDATPSHKEFEIGVELEEAPASEAWHHTDKGGLILHIESVTKIAIAVAEIFEGQYDEKIDMDSLIAAALCHDLMKTTEFEKKMGVVRVKPPMHLDHLTLGVAELYARNFPAKVIHIAAAHHGEGGPLAPSEIEAIILHYADSVDAYGTGQSNPLSLADGLFGLPFVRIDDED